MFCNDTMYMSTNKIKIGTKYIRYSKGIRNFLFIPIYSYKLERQLQPFETFASVLLNTEECANQTHEIQ